MNPDPMTPFETAWGEIVKGFALADAMGAAALEAAGRQEYAKSAQAMEAAQAHAERILTAWSAATFCSTAWASLDEPLREFVDANVQLILATRAGFVLGVSGYANHGAPPALFANMLVKLKALTDAARALSASLGGDPARLPELGG